MDVTIGVFDSGFGGLTVLRELLAQIPGARYVYLGDTARLPYGSKSRETIARYAVSSAHFLQQQGAELLVIACNTASALALEDLRAALPIPIIGVIEPGTQAAAATAHSERRQREPEVLVLATQATVESHAYARTCAAHGLRAFEKACPLLVPLVEEGWNGDADAAKDSVTSEVLRIYLSEALSEAPNSRAALLGCTHYPLLRPAIEETLAELGHAIPVIDSAHATARTVASMVDCQEATLNTTSQSAVCEFYATDSVEKFAHLGSRFLGRQVENVQLVNLGG